MASSSSPEVCVAPYDQRLALADMLERSRDRILAAWESAASAILASANGDAHALVEGKLASEGQQTLELLIQRLRDPRGGAHGADRRSCAMGNGLRSKKGRQPHPLTRYRLQTAFTEAVWDTIAGELPPEWSGITICQLRADVAAIVSKVVGATPAALLEEAQERFERDHQELSAAFARTLFMQEEERRRIARDVHDVLAQALAGARLRADTAIRLLPKDIEQAIAETIQARELMEYSLSHIRDIIFELRPIALDRFGLRAAVEDYAARLQRTHAARITVTGSGDSRRLAPETATCLFRIAQTVLSGMVIQAGLREADVELNINGEIATLSVQPRGAMTSGASGGNAGGCWQCDLPTLRERAELLGGSLRLHELDEGGEKLEVVVPLRSEGVSWKPSEC